MRKDKNLFWRLTATQLTLIIVTLIGIMGATTREIIVKSQYVKEVREIKYKRLDSSLKEIKDLYIEYDSNLKHFNSKDSMVSITLRGEKALFNFDLAYEGEVKFGKWLSKYNPYLSRGATLKLAAKFEEYVSYQRGLLNIIKSKIKEDDIKLWTTREIVDYNLLYTNNLKSFYLFIKETVESEMIIYSNI